MAECNIDESRKANGTEFKGNNEQEAMAHLMWKHMVKHLKDSDEAGKEFIDSKFWKFFRLDRAGVTDHSKNKLTRQISNILYESLGRTGKDWVRSRTMSQVKSFEMNRLRMLYYRDWTQQFDVWLKENNLKGLNINGLTKRVDFNKEVTKAIRKIGTKEFDAIESESVKAMAKAQSARYKELLEMAKAAGVRGADQVDPNPAYLTRVWSKNNLTAFVAKHGEKKLFRLMANAIDNGDDIVKRIKLAEHLYRVIIRGNTGQNINIGNVLNAKIEDLDEMLRGMVDGIDEDTIQGIITGVFGSRTTSGGKIKYMRKRLKFNENYSDDTGAISDFFENDSEILFLNYTNQMTGQIALAQRGFRSRADWEAMKRNIEKEYEALGMGDKHWVRKNEMKALQSGYDWLIGKPLENDVTGAFSTFGRIMRKYNFGRIMNQVGFAQLAEIGVLVANLGLVRTIKYLPEMRRLLKRSADGKIDDDFMKEAEEVFGGFGSERLINQVANQTEELGNEVGNYYRKARKVEVGLDHVSRLTADISGMHGVNMIMKRILLKGIVQKYLDEAYGGAKVLSNKRLRDLGISDTMHKRVLKMIKENADTYNGALTNRKIKRINIDKWTDTEAASTFAHAINRYGRRTIQENDIGEQMFLGGLTDSTWGKIMFQFRGFMMTAYGKHLLHGMKMRDFQAFAGMMTSMIFAGLAFTAQTQAQMAILSPRKRKELWEKKFGKTTEEFWLNFAKAGFQRSAFASILPAIYDSGHFWATGNPFFHYRSTGLDSNLLTGNPTVSFLSQKLYKGTGESVRAMLDSDYDFNQKTFNKLTQLLLLQNALGIQNIIRRIGEETLPEKP